MTAPLAGTGIPPLPVKSLGIDQLALLQQQNRLQQLQLLQQMQSMASNQQWQALDHGYAVDPSHPRSHSLMPSIDIVSEPIHDPRSEFMSNRNLSTQARVQSSTRDHVQHNQVASKHKIAGLPGSTSLLDVGHGHHRHAANVERVLRHHQSFDLDGSAVYLFASVEKFRTYQFYRQATSVCNILQGGGAHLHEEISNSNGRRHINILEDSEIPNVSPALTYTSRSPASLSPSTPLFNTFGTPASAPATVPLGKPTLRDRERAFRHELRQ